MTADSLAWLQPCAANGSAGPSELYLLIGGSRPATFAWRGLYPPRHTAKIALIPSEMATPVAKAMASLALQAASAPMRAARVAAPMLMPSEQAFEVLQRAATGRALRDVSSLQVHAQRKRAVCNSERQG